MLDTSEKIQILIWICLSLLGEGEKQKQNKQTKKNTTWINWSCFAQKEWLISCIQQHLSTTPAWIPQKAKSASNGHLNNKCLRTH